MSVIPPALKQTVVFLFDSDDAHTLRPIGTGFFVGIVQEKMVFAYLVTAKHVLKGRRRAFVRINQRGEGAVFGAVEIEGNSMWTYHTDPAVDVAILPWAPSPEKFDIRFVPKDNLVTKELMTKESVTEGDEILFVSLLPQFYQTRRVSPVVRFGRISLLPEDPVVTRDGEEDLYFAECQSFPGCSGSPVFLRFGATRRPNQIVIGDRIFLLGLMKGHFREKGISVEEPGETYRRFEENVGIAAVVPSEKILDVLNMEILVRHRETTFRNEEDEHKQT